MQLAQLCEVLVMLREQQDREGQEALYTDTLALLSGGNQQVRRDECVGWMCVDVYEHVCVCVL